MYNLISIQHKRKRNANSKNSNLEKPPAPTHMQLFSKAQKRQCLRQFTCINFMPLLQEKTVGLCPAICDPQSMTLGYKTLKAVNIYCLSKSQITDLLQVRQCNCGLRDFRAHRPQTDDTKKTKGLPTGSKKGP